MIVDGGSDSLPHILLQVVIEDLHTGVEAADNSLQFRKFFDEFGREISLRKACGFVKHAGTDCDAAIANSLRQPTANPLHAPCLLVVAA